jgi:hypothetical protein
MPYEQITLRPASVRKARTSVRDHLADLGCDRVHLLAVESVVAELLGVAIDSGEHDSVALSVASFPLLTSVRLQCSPGLTWRDDPLGLRDRILERLTTAVGQRRRTDGGIELWAEIPKTNAHDLAKL